jgi:hypothetical protein
MSSSQGGPNYAGERPSVEISPINRAAVTCLLRSSIIWRDLEGTLRAPPVLRRFFRRLIVDRTDCIKRFLPKCYVAFVPASAAGWAGYDSIIRVIPYSAP